MDSETVRSETIVLVDDTNAADWQSIKIKSLYDKRVIKDKSESKDAQAKNFLRCDSKRTVDQWDEESNDTNKF